MASLLLCLVCEFTERVWIGTGGAGRRDQIKICFTSAPAKCCIFRLNGRWSYVPSILATVRTRRNDPTAKEPPEDSPMCSKTRFTCSLIPAESARQGTPAIPHVAYGSVLLCPRLLKGIIFILRRGDIISNLLEMYINFVKSEYVTWTAGWLAGNQSWDHHWTQHISYPSDCSCVADSKCWQISWATHRRVSLAHCRSSAIRNPPT
jgi:hypothetical protein